MIIPCKADWTPGQQLTELAAAHTTSSASQLMRPRTCCHQEYPPSSHWRRRLEWRSEDLWQEERQAPELANPGWRIPRKKALNPLNSRHQLFWTFANWWPTTLRLRSRAKCCSRFHSLNRREQRWWMSLSWCRPSSCWETYCL